jgi:hypothetical protein
MESFLLKTPLVMGCVLLLRREFFIITFSVVPLIFYFCLSIFVIGGGARINLLYKLISLAILLENSILNYYSL